MEALIALALLLIVPGWLVFLWLKARKRTKRLRLEVENLRDKLTKANEAAGNLTKEKEQLEARLEKAEERLEYYRPVRDAEERAKTLLEEAEAQIETIKTDALAEAREIETEAAETLAEAKAEAQTLKAEIAEKRMQAASLLDGANLEARAIVETANRKAEEIAGEAWTARNRAKEYEQLVIALKNIIEGYGDAYVIPAKSILDGLADTYGFAEAGEQLKLARARSRSMAKAGEGAKCDYREENRKTTAQAFVLDAFNGKADTILSKIKTDNIGTLIQEMEDAYIQVNALGAAFRNARITPEYKEARLAELKWAASVIELREREREEQRAIKEKMREEEKARRDYERAIREAAKDEARLQEALERARQEMAQASEEQKQSYELKLAALQEKLQEAEAKSQRALSMAQQTRSGFVYVISNIGSFGEEVFKIGMTRRLEPMDRVRELGDASVPFPFDVHAMIYCEDAPAIETALHKRFNDLRLNKVNPRKEFFKLGLDGIREAANELGLEAEFTILAEAREFRDSLALGKLPKQEREAQMEKIMQEEISESSELDVADA